MRLKGTARELDEIEFTQSHPIIEGGFPLLEVVSPRKDLDIGSLVTPRVTEEEIRMYIVLVIIHLKCAHIGHG